jgi:hypothetical protein
MRRCAVLLAAEGERPTHGVPTGAAFALKMRPTTAPSASTSKPSSFHSPERREADARLRIRLSLSMYPVPRSFHWHFRHVELGVLQNCEPELPADGVHVGFLADQLANLLPVPTLLALVADCALG